MRMPMEPAVLGELRTRWRDIVFAFPYEGYGGMSNEEGCAPATGLPLNGGVW
jgi:hypothetical protein